MQYGWRGFLRLFTVCLLVLQLCACGDNGPWRYNPGAPDKPAGLVATADNGQVSIGWQAANNAAAYNIYYATSPGVSRANGTKIANVVSTSYIQTELTNDKTYYFVVTSLNSSGESAESNQVTAIPAMLGNYLQSDMEGVWSFNILVTGAGAGWMRGTLSVNNAGAVAFSSFLDNGGHVLPPAGLFPALYLSSNGRVRDTIASPAVFQGGMAASRKMVVGNAAPDGASQMLVILQKQLPGVTYSNAGDIQGFGNTGGGGRRFIYNQISSGANQEWEFAEGQIGRDQKIQYTTFSAPSNPLKPGDKASIFNISAGGMVTESLTAAAPQPAVVIDSGFMSADKSTIVATATDTSGAAPRYILRIYQLVNILFSDSNIFALSDLTGSYRLWNLLGGTGAQSASGNLAINAAGRATFSSYTDSLGSAVLPADFSLAIDVNGKLVNPANATVLGKLSYFKEMFVVTGTDSVGAYSLGIALKQ